MQSINRYPMAPSAFPQLFIATVLVVLCCRADTNRESREKSSPGHHQSHGIEVINENSCQWSFFVQTKIDVVRSENRYLSVLLPLPASQNLFPLSRLQEYS